MSLSSKHTYNQHLAILTEFPKEKPSRENLDLPPTHVPPDRHAHTHTHTHTHHLWADGVHMSKDRGLLGCL